MRSDSGRFLLLRGVHHFAGKRCGFLVSFGRSILLRQQRLDRIVQLRSRLYSAVLLESLQECPEPACRDYNRLILPQLVQCRA